MSASPATTSVFASTPGISFEKSKSTFIASPIFSGRSRPVLDARRKCAVELIHRRSLHHLRHVGADVTLLREDVGIEPISAERRRHDDESINDLGVANGRQKCNAAAERVAHDVHAAQTEVLDERRDVVGHERNAERTIDIRCTPMSLQIDADHLTVRGERAEVRAKHLDGAKPAVQKDQWASLAVSLIVELDPVDVGVIALGGLTLVPTGRRLWPGLLSWKSYSDLRLGSRHWDRRIAEPRCAERFLEPLVAGRRTEMAEIDTVGENGKSRASDTSDDARPSGLPDWLTFGGRRCTGQFARSGRSSLSLPFRGVPAIRSRSGCQTARTWMRRTPRGSRTAQTRTSSTSRSRRPGFLRRRTIG